MESEGFYNWLSSQFSDVETACYFARDYVDRYDQETPFGGYSTRSLCCHISIILECMEDGNNNYEEKAKQYIEEGWTNYSATKYGTKLYWEMWGTL